MLKKVLQDALWACAWLLSLHQDFLLDFAALPFLWGRLGRLLSLDRVSAKLMYSITGSTETSLTVMCVPMR